MAPIILIGGGLAGYNTARELRKLESQLPLLLVSGDAAAFYSKPMLSLALGQGKQAAELVTADAATMAARLQAEVISHCTVTAIDPAGHRVRLGERWHDYRQLVIATGANPIRLPLAGDAADQVITLNTLEEYSDFRQRLTAARRVVVIGPGLIGCEFANDLAGAGYGVMVIGPDRWPLSGLLPEVAGRALQRGLAEIGVEWWLESSVLEVAQQGAGYRLTLLDGKQISADLVLSAVGIRPAVELARQAGLRVNRGVVTDRQLRSSDPDIFALGDCAEVDGQVLPYVAPLMAAAKALAKTLAGTPTAVDYPPMPVVIKTTHHPLVVMPPPAAASGEWQCHEDSQGVRCLFQDSTDKLRGFVLTGDHTKARQALLKRLAGLA